MNGPIQPAIIIGVMAPKNSASLDSFRPEQAERLLLLGFQLRGRRLQRPTL